MSAACSKAFTNATIDKQMVQSLKSIIKSTGQAMLSITQKNKMLMLSVVSCIQQCERSFQMVLHRCLRQTAQGTRPLRHQSERRKAEMYQNSI